MKPLPKSSILILGLFVLPFLLPFERLNAQNTDWHPIPDSLPSLYHRDGGGSSNFPVAGVQVDSILAQGTNTIYHLTPVVRDTGTGYQSCMNPKAGGLMGKKVVRLDTGQFVFFNGKGDSLHLRTRLGFGESWPVYIYPNSDTLIGTVVELSYDSVLSGEQAVKKIRLERVDSGSGYSVQDSINGTSLRVAKGTGLLELPSMYWLPHGYDNDDPTHSDSYELYRQGLYSREEIYTKKVEEVFHIEKKAREDGYNGITQADVRLELFNKTYFSSTDSVSYHFQRRRLFYDFDPAIGAGYTISDTVVDTIQRGYADLSEPFLDAIPRELVDSGEWSGDGPIVYKLSLGKIGGMNEDCKQRAFISYDRPSLEKGPGDTCYRRPSEGTNITSKTFGAGLGRTASSFHSYVQGTHYIYNETYLVYHEKVDDVCGDPLVRVGQPSYSRKELSLRIHPNPFERTVRIKGLETQKIRSIVLFDLQGRRLRSLEGKDIQKESLRISGKGLSPGPYILKVRTRKGSHSRKLIKE